jgi:hypothetical protein
MVRTRVLRFCTVIAAGAAAIGHLDAQSRDPVAEAQSLFDARHSATNIAGVLKREYSRTIAQSSTILRTVGFDAKAVVPALRAEYTPSLTAVYTSMKEAGFTTRSIVDAFASNRIALDCIDLQGYPMPCGNFGGTADAAVTGQLTLSPAAEGSTNGKLTITGSNIPAVTVRLGATHLAQLQASSSAVVVRLPSTPQTADLEIIRESDGVTGLLRKDYRVVAPPLAWSNFTLPAIEGAVSDMKRWISGAKLSGCVVNGAVATASPGAFTSSTGFGGEVRARLLAAGAPSAVANAWDAAFQAAFTGYTSGVVIPSLPLYPTLAAVPAPNAVPVANVPTPLGVFVSVGALGMQPPGLGAAIAGPLASVSEEDPARTTAISTFASAVGAKFSAMLLEAMVINLLGGGPVPKYAPPVVPAAPVEGGSCAGSNIVTVPSSVF